jgi:hypothetical protein
MAPYVGEIPKGVIGERNARDFAERETEKLAKQNFLLGAEDFPWMVVVPPSC